LGSGPTCKHPFKVPWQTRGEAGFSRSVRIQGSLGARLCLLETPLRAANNSTHDRSGRRCA